MSTILFELDSRIQNVMDSLPEDGEVDDLLGTMLDELGADRHLLISQLTRVLDNHSALEEMFSTQSLRLSNRARYHSARIQSVRGYLLASMSRLGETQIRTDDRTISRRDGPYRVDTVDVDKLPEEFIQKIPKKSDILRKFKETGELPEGTTTAKSEVLTIRMR